MDKKPLKALVGGIQKFSIEDGPGIRTTVFLKGCPLNCKWCHNPELIDFRQQIIQMPNSCIGCGVCINNCTQNAVHVNDEKKIRIDWNLCNWCMECVDSCFAKALQPVAKLMTISEIMHEVEQDKGFYKNTNGGMTISGGEMLSQPEFVKELVEDADIKGINVCLDTSGYGDGNKLKILASMKNVTNILYDMKSIDDDIHKECVGQSNHIILENLKMLAAIPDVNRKIQMRMPLISGHNDKWSIIEATAEFYKANHIKKVTLLPYHNLGVSKKANIGGTQNVFKAPTDAHLDNIKRLFEDRAEMRVEILGRT